MALLPNSTPPPLTATIHRIFVRTLLAAKNLLRSRSRSLLNIRVVKEYPTVTSNVGLTKREIMAVVVQITLSISLRTEASRQIARTTAAGFTQPTPDSVTPGPAIWLSAPIARRRG
jgi:CRISPR/Cas system-associated exonuclease Cas4 (RecB family)